MTECWSRERSLWPRQETDVAVIFFGGGAGVGWVADSSGIPQLRSCAGESAPSPSGLLQVLGSQVQPSWVRVFHGCSWGRNKCIKPHSVKIFVCQDHL